MAHKKKGTKRSRTKKKILGIQERLGVGAQGQSDVGIARGTSPGELNPLLAGLSNEELAELDRLQFNRDLTRNNPIAGVVGSLGLAGADALKALGILEPVAGAVLPALGFSEEATAEFTQPGEHTSKPSFSQAFSNLRGAGQGFQDIGRAITSQFQTGGQVPMAQDNPFGGLRIPTDFLLQQFQAGGQVGPRLERKNVGPVGSLPPRSSMAPRAWSRDRLSSVHGSARYRPRRPGGVAVSDKCPGQRNRELSEAPRWPTRNTCRWVNVRVAGPSPGALRNDGNSV